MSDLFDFMTELTRAYAAANNLTSTDLLARELYQQSLDDGPEPEIVCLECLEVCREAECTTYKGRDFCSGECAHEHMDREEG